MPIIETSENEVKELYQTHYYKASYNQIKELYKEYITSIGFKILSENDDYSEIFAEKGAFTVTAKIIMQNPKETSIDFCIDAVGFFANSSAKKFVLNVYKAIEAKYEFKGVGLHK